MGTDSFQDTNEIAAYETLGADINKPKNDSEREATGLVGGKLPELTLEMSNADIAALTKKWEDDWNKSTTKSEWEHDCKENEKYWQGLQFDVPKANKNRPNVDNVIFQSVETYLPEITKRNPEPLVTLSRELQADPNAQGFVVKVKARLGELADENRLRIKLKRVGRFWLLNLIGVSKLGWDLDEDRPTIKVTRPKKLLLDPECVIDEDGYHGRYLGEMRKLEGSKILAIVKNQPESPDKAEAVKVLEATIGDNKGSEVSFIEWWTPQYFVWKLKETILYKSKNPHWNYDKTLPAPTLPTDPAQPASPEAIAAAGTSVDGYGNASAQPTEVKGINHFKVPKIPYIFLVMFSIDDRPMDKTSLIGQNLANQDRINKRNKQIDRNVDNMNGGLIVSLERSGLTESQAKNVSSAYRKGGIIAVPAGAPQDAIWRPETPGLPGDVFADRDDTRNRLLDIFGTRGSTPTGVAKEKTVRGKYLMQGLDTDRIGGGISEYVEQHADAIYNYLVQLLYVYEPDFIGQNPPRIKVSVKEGSLLPQDSTTIASQAIDLASAGKMSLIDLYKRLEFANPEEMAANVWLETNAPELLFAKDPRVQQAIQMKQQAAQGAEKKAPSQSINFKDVDPNAKAAMLAEVGIQSDPNAIAAHEIAKEAAKAPVQPANDSQPSP